MGIGFVIIVDPASKLDAINILATAGETPVEIGRIVDGGGGVRLI